MFFLLNTVKPRLSERRSCELLINRTPKTTARALIRSRFFIAKAASFRFADGTMAEKSGKRKRTVLSIEKKLQICKKLRNGATATDLSKEFEVGKSTITDIRKSEDKLRSFAICCRV